ncbi:MAG: hypothetical protein IJ428_06905 [Clostridia bacterium]|nr:hypothetical protein [Clostridia bacterium]
MAEIIKNNTPIKYVRTIGVTESVEPYGDMYRYKGTIYHHRDWDNLFELGKRFLEPKTDTL